MSVAKINELRNNITELTELLKQVTRKRVYDFLTKELRNLEIELLAVCAEHGISMNDALTTAPSQENGEKNPEESDEAEPMPVVSEALARSRKIRISRATRASKHRPRPRPNTVKSTKTQS